MSTKIKTKINKKRNLPIPLALFTSYIAAEKSDELIKVFCQELPDILKDINSRKKALESKKTSVSKLKEDIKHDLNKLELANVVLNEIYREEEERKNEREKEIQMLALEISALRESQASLKKSYDQFYEAKRVLDEVAVISNRYPNAQSLIQSYLTLQAMNEKLIQDQFDCADKVKDMAENNFELDKLKVNHKYNLLVRENQLKELEAELQCLTSSNYELSCSINEAYVDRKQKYLDWMQIRRWAYDTCQKLGSYKDTPTTTQEFPKLINEIQEFILFSNKILPKLSSS